ncbi:MAG: hypothetical protein LBK61_00485 [Spirochaetaceae bacterium]|jgi:hypothetical protein|nr:hypothetical protein [Spirochaetaceae bacterium]
MASYIPKSYELFNLWFKFLVQYVTSKTSGTAPAWTHIPKAVLDMITDTYAAWYTVYGKTLGPHTPVDTLAKQEGRKAAEKAVRAFVNQYLRFFPVTDEDRKAMGIPNRDTKPTPVPAPTSQAEADLVFPGIHLVELVKIRKAGILSDDPRSDYGVSVHFGILDAVNSEWRVTAPPASGKDLPHSVFTREKKILFDFDGESGKTVYFCLRYENQKGGKKGWGPFGPVLHAVIP